ncbi:HPr family phosphocarrier protein [Archangium gephyra]|jgi:phosphocarrier protein HPr|uniref:HPr family phosphocarrier protein n=1 Tax=Archangium gephyra TaxID=48 RepID=UPI002C44B591|nr:HPr family phosphocarrier protein [Myxococcaceae bacterium]HZH17964.1 HPr family phosphocarrier protein [Archangium sp.]HZI04765.1 HPr family phosphocarrier protein [Archangium sp.]
MSSVAEGTFEIINALGLHARAAAQLVQVANRYKSEVTLLCEGQKANAKSIMGVLMLAAAQGMEVTVTCKGDDAEACLQDIQKLIANRFGESK